MITNREFDYESSKKILLVNPLKGIHKNWNFAEENEEFKNCQIQNCFLTDNRNQLGYLRVNQFDAYLFDLNFLKAEDVEFLPTKRFPEARYIAYFDKIQWPRFLDQYENLFNWTMSTLPFSDLRIEAPIESSQSPFRIWKNDTKLMIYDTCITSLQG